MILETRWYRHLSWWFEVTVSLADKWKEGVNVSVINSVQESGCQNIFQYLVRYLMASVKWSVRYLRLQVSLLVGRGQHDPFS